MVVSERSRRFGHAKATSTSHRQILKRYPVHKFRHEYASKSHSRDIAGAAQHWQLTTETSIKHKHVLKSPGLGASLLAAGALL